MTSHFQEKPATTRYAACIICGRTEWVPIRKGTPLHPLGSTKTFTLAKCVSCQHIALNPPPSDEDLRISYSVEYAPYRPAWKTKGWPLWKILRELTTYRRLRRLKHHASGARLLEVGSGAGDFLYAANHAGWQVAAVEYSSELAMALRTELGFDVRSGELREELWQYGEFDVVVMWSVLEHVRDPLAALKLVVRYLKPKGSLFLQIPTRNAAEAGRFFGRYWENLEFPRHLNFFDETGLTKLCQSAGLELVLYRTPLMDMAWAYLASVVNYANSSRNLLQRAFRFVLPTVVVLVGVPYLAIQAWRARGTEAFALAVKR